MRRSERLASKRLKAEESYVNGSVDNSRISNLSDNLLHKILSFLKMDIVVRTSILSKRWRYLWKSTPTFDFHITGHGYTEKSQKKSARLIDHILVNRYRCYKLEKFNLKSEEGFFIKKHLHKWIDAATMSPVDKLSLHIQSHTSTAATIRVPDQVFKSGIKKVTVTYLLNSMTSYPKNILLPNSLCSAKHLKSLRLKSVKFPDGETDSCRQIVLNCPVLENLIVKNCELSHLKTLTILTPQLKNLMFCKRYDDCKKILCCPKLTSFYWSGRISEDEEEISFEDISALASVTLKKNVYPSFFWTYNDNDQDELPNLIEPLLKKARVLTEMVLELDPSSPAHRLEEFKQKVLALPTASSNLSISFPFKS